MRVVKLQRRASSSGLSRPLPYPQVVSWAGPTVGVLSHLQGVPRAVLCVGGCGQLLGRLSRVAPEHGDVAPAEHVQDVAKNRALVS